MPDTAPFGYERLLHPYTPSHFFTAWFETTHLHIARDAPGYYDEVLTVAALDAYLQNRMLSHPHVSVSKEGALTPVEQWQETDRYRLTGIADNHRLFALMHEGHTVSLNRLQQALPSVAAFCHRLEMEAGYRAVANVYLTPAHSRGFGLHFDGHDVLVLQISGAKDWAIYATEGAGSDPVLTEALTLRAGDFLYVPRGVYHRAEATDEASVHITLGLYPKRASDLVRALADLAEQDPAFARAIPSAFSPPEARAAFDEAFQASLHTLVERVDAPRLRSRIERQAVRAASHRLEGRLTDVLAAHTLGADTWVRRRLDLPVRLAEEGRSLRIAFYGTELTYPHFLKPTLDQLLGEEPFRVGALVGPLDDASKLELVRTFIREGVLRILPGPEGS